MWFYLYKKGWLCKEMQRTHKILICNSYWTGLFAYWSLKEYKPIYHLIPFLWLWACGYQVNLLILFKRSIEWTRWEGQKKTRAPSSIWCCNKRFFWVLKHKCHGGWRAVPRYITMIQTFNLTINGSLTAIAWNGIYPPKAVKKSLKIANRSNSTR
jgi:hypothetical protein